MCSSDLVKKWSAKLPAIKEKYLTLKYSSNMGKNDSKLSLTCGEISLLIIPVVVTSDLCDLFFQGVIPIVPTAVALLARLRGSP